MTARPDDSRVRCDWVPIDDTPDGILYREYHDTDAWVSAYDGPSRFEPDAALRKTQQGQASA